LAVSGDAATRRSCGRRSFGIAIRMSRKIPSGENRETMPRRRAFVKRECRSRVEAPIRAASLVADRC
jgi:hypothetical protein